MSTTLGKPVHAGVALRTKFFEEAARLAPIPVCVKTGGYKFDADEFAPADFVTNAIDFALGLLRVSSRHAQAQFFAYICESVDASDLLEHAPSTLEQVAGMRLRSILQVMLLEHSTLVMLPGAPAPVQYFVQRLATKFWQAQNEISGEPSALTRRYLETGLEKLQIPLAIACAAVYGSRQSPVEAGAIPKQYPPAAEPGPVVMNTAADSPGSTEPVEPLSLMPKRNPFEWHDRRPKSLTATLIREGRVNRRHYGMAMAMGIGTNDF